VAKKILMQGKALSKSQVLHYFDSINQLTNIIEITAPIPNLPKIYDPNTGVLLHTNPDRLVWRLSSHACQYPPVCEHVPFHASMIIRGHDKLFINPRMIFTYGD
jgi:hypothetical protein